LKAAGYDAKALLAAGFTPSELLAAGFTPQQLTQAGVSPAAIIAAGRASDCSVALLTAAKASGVSATTIRETLGCSAAAMKAAGYTAAELKAAGFTAAELKNAGFSASDLKAAGFSAKELKDAGFTASDLKNAGFSAKDLKDAGFSAKDLKDAGFSAKVLKEAGFSAKDLKDAGFSAQDLKGAGFTAKDLKDAGFSAKDLKDAGFSAQDLKDAGFSANDLKDAGFSAKALLDAGFTPDQISNAGFSAADLAAAGIQNSQVAALNSLGDNPNGFSTMPSVPGYQGKTTKASNAEDENAQKLQQIMSRQTQQQADQRYQQRIQQRSSEMMSSANQSLQGWKKVGTQSYVEGTPAKIKTNIQNQTQGGAGNNQLSSFNQNNISGVGPADNKTTVIVKTGDILFAVIDTSINSDEPGPILATIVSGKLKGAKLIGSFNLPNNADKMVITFNTLSVPGASKTTSINAFAIDADTARTALSSDTNHHYMLRYGSLFASSFLEGFGNAFQSANTTVTVGGVGGTGQVTVQNGIGRSALENAVIGLATVGKSWGQVAQQNFNRPTTVQVYSGTGVGILFTQDLTL
jgi:intracellular multiplication protein IcmE